EAHGPRRPCRSASMGDCDLRHFSDQSSLRQHLFGGRFDGNYSLVRLSAAEWRNRPWSSHLRLHHFSTHHCWDWHRSLAARCPWHGSYYARARYLVYPRWISVVLPAGGRCIATIEPGSDMDQCLTGAMCSAGLWRVLG